MYQLTMALDPRYYNPIARTHKQPVTPLGPFLFNDTITRALRQLFCYDDTEDRIVSNKERFLTVPGLPEEQYRLKSYLRPRESYRFRLTTLYKNSLFRLVNWRLVFFE